MSRSLIPAMGHVLGNLSPPKPFPHLLHYHRGVFARVGNFPGSVTAFFARLVLCKIEGRDFGENPRISMSWSRPGSMGTFALPQGIFPNWWRPAFAEGDKTGLVVSVLHAFLVFSFPLDVFSISSRRPQRREFWDIFPFSRQTFFLFFLNTTFP